jgi:hypothetical protein
VDSTALRAQRHEDAAAANSVSAVKQKETDTTKAMENREPVKSSGSKSMVAKRALEQAGEGKKMTLSNRPKVSIREKSELVGEAHLTDYRL